MSDSTPNPIDRIAAQPTPLAEAVSNSSASLIDYRGARAVEVFSSTREELAALLTHAGVYDLGWRGFLRCAGRDRVRWLNGMVTNSVKDLAGNAGCYAFVLNAQGRIQGDLDIYRRTGDPDSLWLETDRAQLGPLTTFVRRYIIMDQVTLDPEDTWTAIGIAGSDAAEKLGAIGFSVTELSPMHTSEALRHDHPVVVVAAHGPRVPRYEIWVESNTAPDLWKALIEVGATPCGANAVEQLRILEGTPAYGVDIVERDLPQETNQLRALNFNKGCYLGQEIVERIRSRGSVHRTFGGFVLEGNPPPAKTPVLAGEKSVGELTSVARIDIPEIGERVIALGTIRREALESRETLESNAPLTANGNPVTPCALPFDFTGRAVQP